MGAVSWKDHIAEFDAIKKSIRSGNLENVQRILEEKPQLLNLNTPLGTWLQMAVRAQNPEIVNYLISKKIDVNIGWPDYQTPLEWACFESNTKIVQTLLDAGTKIDLSRQETNPLFAAIGGGQSENVKLLLAYGIDPTIEYEADDGMDAMSHAIIQGQWDIGRDIAVWIAKGDQDEGDAIFEKALDKVEAKTGRKLARPSR